MDSSQNNLFSMHADKIPKQLFDSPISVCNIQNNENEIIDITKEIILNNEYFHGKALIMINGIHESNAEYFVGKKRKFEYVIQGRFRKPLSFANLYTGQAFSRQLKMQPPQWLISTLMPIINYFQPSAEVELDGTSPYILSPMMSTMQSIVISQPNDQPALSDMLSRTEDDLTLLDPSIFSGMSVSNRKSFFSKTKNLQNYSFEPCYVYSFSFFQHVLNVATFHLETPIFHYDLLNVIGQQPIECMAVIWNPRDDVKLETPDLSAESGKSDKPESQTSLTQASSTPRQHHQWKYLFDIQIWHNRSVE